MSQPPVPMFVDNGPFAKDRLLIDGQTQPFLPYETVTTEAELRTSLGDGSDSPASA